MVKGKNVPNGFWLGDRTARQTNEAGRRRRPASFDFSLLNNQSVDQSLIIVQSETLDTGGVVTLKPSKFALTVPVAASFS